MRVKDVSGWERGIQLFRGRFQSYGHPKYGLVITKWPRKRGKKRTQAQADNMDTFAQVVAWAKAPLASDVETAQIGTKDTGYLIRDIIESACYGLAVVAMMKDGRILYGRRLVAQDIQAALDTITSTVGSMLVRGPTGWIGLDAGIDQFVITSNGPLTLPTYQQQTGGSDPSTGGTPLYILSPQLPAPSAFTQVNISGKTSVLIGTDYINIIDTGTSALQARGVSIPISLVAPYTIAILGQHTARQTNYSQAVFGWTDGTKLDLINFSYANSTTFGHDTWSSPTTRTASSSIAGGPLLAQSTAIWVGLYDDGTDVHWQFSHDGVQFVDLFSNAKSAGYLGSSGYTNVFMGLVVDNAYPNVLTIRALDMSGNIRKYPTV